MSMPFGNIGLDLQATKGGNNTALVEALGRAAQKWFSNTPYDKKKQEEVIPPEGQKLLATQPTAPKPPNMTRPVAPPVIPPTPAQAPVQPVAALVPVQNAGIKTIDGFMPDGTPAKFEVDMSQPGAEQDLAMAPSFFRGEAPYTVVEQSAQGPMPTAQSTPVMQQQGSTIPDAPVVNMPPPLDTQALMEMMALPQRQAPVQQQPRMNPLVSALLSTAQQYVNQPKSAVEYIPKGNFRGTMGAKGLMDIAKANMAADEQNQAVALSQARIAQQERQQQQQADMDAARNELAMLQLQQQPKMAIANHLIDSNARERAAANNALMDIAIARWKMGAEQNDPYRQTQQKYTEALTQQALNPNRGGNGMNIRSTPTGLVSINPDGTVTQLTQNEPKTISADTAANILKDAGVPVTPEAVAAYQKKFSAAQQGTEAPSSDSQERVIDIMDLGKPKGEKK